MTTFPKLVSSASLTIVGVLTAVASAEAQAHRRATPVEIVAPAPVPVIDAAHPATHAFQLTFCNAVSVFGGNFRCPDGSISILQVPADRSLVIEYISSGFCFVRNLTHYELGIVTQVNGVTADHRVPLVRSALNPESLRASEMVRIYADAGSQISMSGTAAASGGGGAGGAECQANVSGYYVFR